MDLTAPSILRRLYVGPRRGVKRIVASGRAPRAPQLVAPAEDHELVEAAERPALVPAQRSIGVARELRPPPRDALQHHLRLGAGERRPEAEVRAVRERQRR